MFSLSDKKGTITGLAHIGIRVRDMDASIDFYTRLLGFTLTSQQMLGSSHLAFLERGTCLLELISGAQYEERTAGQVDHIALEVRGIEELTSALRAEGVRFLDDEVSTVPALLDGVKNIFFLGPDGERLEFFEYYNR